MGRSARDELDRGFAGLGVDDAADDVGTVAAVPAAAPTPGPPALCRRRRSGFRAPAGVVVHTHPGQHCDLLAAQPGHAPVAAVDGQTCLLRCDLRAAVRKSRISVRPSMTITRRAPRRGWEVLALPGTADTASAALTAVVLVSPALPRACPFGRA